jgi:hypothetical protein
MPAYQGQFNGINLAGGTGSSYARTNVQYAQAGNYSVVVSKLAGSMIGSNGLLSILTAFPAQFQSAAMLSGRSLQLIMADDLCLQSSPAVALPLRVRPSW